MDPNAALEELRAWYNEVVQDEYEVEHLDVVAILSTFDDLDNWIISGGFLPAEWQR